MKVCILYNSVYRHFFFYLKRLLLIVNKTLCRQASPNGFTHVIDTAMETRPVQLPSYLIGCC